MAIQQDYDVKAVRAAVILTNSYVAGTVLDYGDEYNLLTIYWSFTKGSLTTGELKVEFSADGTNYYQESVTSPAAIGSGESVVGVGVAEYQVDTTGNYRITIPINDKYIKISALGTGTVTSSSATVTAILGVV